MCIQDWTALSGLLQHLFKFTGSGGSMWNDRASVCQRLEKSLFWRKTRLKVISEWAPASQGVVQHSGWFPQHFLLENILSTQRGKYAPTNSIKCAPRGRSLLYDVVCSDANVQRSTSRRFVHCLLQVNTAVQHKCSWRFQARDAMSFTEINSAFACYHMSVWGGRRVLVSTLDSERSFVSKLPVLLSRKRFIRVPLLATEMIRRLQRMSE